jgi:hypothetical protein
LHRTLPTLSLIQTLVPPQGRTCQASSQP